jgi:hypothetical protein
MSTVKISELPLISQINANTANTLFAGVDIPTSATFRMTAKTIAQGLYSNEILNVGTNPVIFSNTAAQFSGSDPVFLQVNFQNFNANGSADYILTSDVGTNATNYVDLGINNSQFNNTGFTSMFPQDGYLYVFDGVVGNTTGNLVVGTASVGSNVKFVVGGLNAQNVVARMTSTGLVMNTQSSITFSDGSVQTVAASPANYSQAAFAQANVIVGVDTTQNSRITIIEATDVSQNSRMVIIEGVDVGQNTAISATNGKMQSAYNTANSALPNTTGTFAGTLNISNNLTVNGTVVLANTNFATTEAVFRITGTGSSQTPTQSGTLMQLTSKQNTPARVLIDSIGTSNTSYSIIAGRTARGTVDTPTATQNNDILLRIAGNSYGTTGYAPFGDARIDFVATENHSDTNRGSRIRFWNTPTGSNVVNEIASFNGDSVTFTGTVAPVKGFIYTPTIFPSAQTAITIDFANNSVVRAQTSSGLTVTLSNYLTGKVVDAWITNTAGTNQTFTHGCSAINSTVNATTYNIPSTSTIFVKYWCMDGTLTNTFVSIVHA